MANHVEEDAELRFVIEGAPLVGVVAATVEAVHDRHVFREGFFAIEEDDLDLICLLRFVFGEVFSNFNDSSAGRCGVVGTEELLILEIFGVDVGADESFDIAFPCVLSFNREAGAEVGKFDFTDGGVAFEFL